MEFNSAVNAFDAKKNISMKNQLREFFTDYKSHCTNEHGVVVFSTKSKEIQEMFGGNEPPIIKQLNDMMNAFSFISGDGSLKIYKVKRKQSVKYTSDSNTLTTIFMVIGDNAFFKTPVPTSGRATGRAPEIVRVLNGGQVLMLKPNQSCHVLSSEKETVFVKGQGRKEVKKPENFEQFIVVYEMRISNDILKTMRSELGKTGSIDGLVQKNKGKVDEMLESMGMNPLDSASESVVMDSSESTSNQLTDAEMEFMP